jgi:hypothetical protein
MIDVSLPLWLLAVQWTLLIALTALVIIMYRQMGYYLGVSESGTENVGLDIGAAAEAFSYTQVAPEIKGGQRFEPSGRWSLLLFIDPSCSGCERSLAALDALREEGSLMGCKRRFASRPGVGLKVGHLTRPPPQRTRPAQPARACARTGLSNRTLARGASAGRPGRPPG